MDEILSSLAASLIVIGIAIAVLIGIDHLNGGSAHHKYKVVYSGYKNSSLSDYTDEIKHNGNCIEYTDHNHHHIERCGTFEVIYQGK